MNRIEFNENRSQLLYRLKVRIENLETIVLEKERNRRFAEGTNVVSCLKCHLGRQK